MHDYNNGMTGRESEHILKQIVRDPGLLDQFTEAEIEELQTKAMQK